MMKFLHLLALLVVAGCGINRPAVERQEFLLRPQRADTAPAAPALGSLRVGRINVAQPFDGRAFVYRRDGQRYETDFYNGFAAEPADMLADGAAAWLRRSGRFQEVLPARSLGTAELRLDAVVSSFYVDFRATPAAVLAIHWRLSRGDSLILESGSEEAVQLAAKTPAAAAQAYQEAFARALNRLEKDLGEGRR